MKFVENLALMKYRAKKAKRQMRGYGGYNQTPNTGKKAAYIQSFYISITAAY